MTEQLVAICNKRWQDCSAAEQTQRREYNAQFVPGRKFCVIKAGASVGGMKPIGPGCHQGWHQKLEIGDVLICDGQSMTFGDGVPAVKWRMNSDDGHRIRDCIFSPVSGGMWGGQFPVPGYLEPAD